MLAILLIGVFTAFHHLRISCNPRHPPPSPHPPTTVSDRPMRYKILAFQVQCDHLLVFKASQRHHTFGNSSQSSELKELLADGLFISMCPIWPLAVSQPHRMS